MNREGIALFSRNSTLTTHNFFLVLATAKDVEHDVEQQAAATDQHGWGKHKNSPFPWDVPKKRSESATAVKA